MLNHKQIAIVDCQVAGISGDMFLAALIDLGANLEKIIDGIKSLEKFIEHKRIEVEVKDVIRKGFHAKKVDFNPEVFLGMKGNEIIEAIKKSIESLKLTDKAKKFALNVAYTLLNAEAKLHGENISDIHLHEIGRVDMIAEIIGSTIALDDLGFFNFKVYSTPVAVGGGLLKFSHGIVPNPAPATLEILKSKNFPLIGGPIESELTTPTGASILVNLVNEVVRFYPLIKPIKVGYGAGMKDFKEFPNVLRIVVGKQIDNKLLKDEIIVLETNIDDVNGEIIGYAIEKLLNEGAKDVSIIPVFTKKNRPAQILKVITDREKAEDLSRILIEEVGTFGVRMYPCERRILTREYIPIEIEINGLKEIIKIKVAKDAQGNIVRIKPEYDWVKNLANKTGKPLREIMKIVEDKARKKIFEGII